MNDNGVTQAREAAKRLNETSIVWEAMVSSPLSRAQQTATEIIQTLTLKKFEVKQDLIERSFGKAEGLKMTDSMAKWPAEDYPSGESREEFQSRMVNLSAELSNQNTQALIVVSHVMVIRAVARNLAGFDPGHVANGSVTMLKLRGRSWSVS